MAAASDKNPVNLGERWEQEAGMLLARVRTIVNNTANSMGHVGYTRDNEINGIKDDIRSLETKIKELESDLTSTTTTKSEIAKIKQRIKDERKRLEDKKSTLKAREKNAVDVQLLNNALESLRSTARSYMERVNALASRRKPGTTLKAPRNVLQEVSAALERSPLVNIRSMYPSDINALQLSQNMANALASIVYALEEHANSIEDGDDQPSSDVTGLGFSGTTAALYGLKLLGIAASYAASHASASVFMTLHEAGGDDPERRPDLRWQAGIFVFLSLLFNLLFSGCLYVLFLLGVPGIDIRIIWLHIIDAVLAHCAVLATLLWMADTLQSRFYFEYETDSARASRLLRQLCVAVIMLHALIPYYSIAQAMQETVEKNKAATAQEDGDQENKDKKDDTDEKKGDD